MLLPSSRSVEVEWLSTYAGMLACLWLIMLEGPLVHSQAEQTTSSAGPSHSSSSLPTAGCSSSQCPCQSAAVTLFLCRPIAPSPDDLQAKLKYQNPAVPAVGLLGGLCKLQVVVSNPIRPRAAMPTTRCPLLCCSLPDVLSTPRCCQSVALLCPLERE